MGKVLIAVFLILCGCATNTQNVKPVKVEFREVGDSLRINYKVMVTEDGKSSHAVSGKNLLDNSHVSKAFVSEQGGSYSINIVLTGEGAEIMKKVSTELKGKRLAILIDGRLITAPMIQETISGGEVQISGNFTKEEAEDIAKGLTPKN